MKWLNIAVECEIITLDDATGVHQVKKQTAKLSEIYNYSASRNVIICKVCNNLHLIVISEKANHGVNRRWIT